MVEVNNSTPETSIQQTNTQPSSPIRPKGFEYLPFWRDERFSAGIILLVIGFIYLFDYSHNGWTLSVGYSILGIILLTYSLIPQCRLLYPQDEPNIKDVLHRFVKKTESSIDNTYIQFSILCAAFLFNLLALILLYRNFSFSILFFQIVGGFLISISTFSFFRSNQLEIDFDFTIPPDSDGKQQELMLLFDLRLYASIIAIFLGLGCIVHFIQRDSLVGTSILDVIFGFCLFFLTTVPQARQIINNSHTKLDSVALPIKFYRTFQLAGLWIILSSQFISGIVFTLQISPSPLAIINFFRAIIFVFLLVSLYRHHNSVEAMGDQERLIKLPPSDAVNHDIENSF
jgi:hypothetical protein